LRGALSTLKTHMPWIIVEVQQDTSIAAGYTQEQILDLLVSVGYKFYEIEKNSSLKPLTIQNLKAYQNVLCVAQNSNLSV
jgi:hypothetical protein